MRFWLTARMKQTKDADVFASCLDRVETPEDVAACLARYPGQADRLEPLLRTALEVRQKMPAPIREDRRVAARQQFLLAAQRQSRAAAEYATERLPGPRQTPGILLRPIWSTFAPAAVAAALFLIALVPIMSLTSSTSLPGDWNYGFKRSTERVRLALTLDPGDRLNLELAFHSRRLGEIERLAADGRLEPGLLQQFTVETSALVQSVSDNPQLGPSDALKVVEQTHAQVQALSDKVAPLASASLKPSVDDAVQQSQQVQLKANEVAQAKVDSAATKSNTQPGTSRQGIGRSKSAILPDASSTPDDSSTATATATATASATPTATATATVTATATSTAVTLVPPSQTAPTLRPPAVPAPVLRPPAVVTATPSPLVPPSQPPLSQAIVAKQLPAGQTTTFIYTGPEMTIPQALASIAGYYRAVFYTQPRTHGGQVYEWYPGQSDPSIVLEPGSQVTIDVKPGAPATLTFAAAPDAVPSR